jgi:hypothetical protein
MDWLIALIAKAVFQVHGVDADGAVVIRCSIVVERRAEAEMVTMSIGATGRQQRSIALS